MVESVAERGLPETNGEVGRLPPDPAQHEVAYREEFARAMACRR